ncbi:none [Leptomonas seymouri]|uniref:None n=1 Tax=Leptomonas seymouri TaxID=5684 RepID=A0A0N0P2U3_LEPSE|nr:none [Leptomonas seymouri]|eukprot:KPI83359.1 none [Leptomonas seymouri]
MIIDQQLGCATERKGGGRHALNRSHVRGARTGHQRSGDHHAAMEGADSAGGGMGKPVVVENDTSGRTPTTGAYGTGAYTSTAMSLIDEHEAILCGVGIHGKRVWCGIGACLTHLPYAV